MSLLGSSQSPWMNTTGPPACVRLLDLPRFPLGDFGRLIHVVPFARVARVARRLASLGRAVAKTGQMRES
jgi:hypothetical protein